MTLGLLRAYWVVYVSYVSFSCPSISFLALLQYLPPHLLSEFLPPDIGGLREERMKAKAVHAALATRQ